MSQPTILLVCPNCKRTCRTRQETRPGAKMRCPGCQNLFYFVVHGNGAVELRPVDDRPQPATELRLPPRAADQGETRSTRRIFTSRRRNRPIGGYAPFEKSRSYLGAFLFWVVLGLGLVAASWYVRQIQFITGQSRRGEVNIWQSHDEGKRKDFQARQKRALEKLQQ
jgi:hypothetical protein